MNISFEIVTVDDLQFAINPNDIDIVSQTVLSGKPWEPYLLDVFARYVKEGDVVLDIGANIGFHTVNLAKLAGASGQVLAFEPQEYLCPQIQRSVSLNNMTDRVVVYQNAVGDVERYVPIEFVHPHHMGKTGRVRIFEGTAQAYMITIDQLQLPKVDFMKIDVETFEALVIQGAMDTIRRCNPIIVYEWFSESTSPLINELLVSLGYTITKAPGSESDWIALPLTYAT
jgi:FkbM family methyltransferase